MKITNKKVLALADELYKYVYDRPNLISIREGVYTKEVGFPDLSYRALLLNKGIRKKYLMIVENIKETEVLNNYDTLALDEILFCLDYVIFPVSPLMEKHYYLDFNVTPYSIPLFYIFDRLALFDCSTAENVDKHMEMSKDYIRFTKQLKDKVIKQADKGIYILQDAIAGCVNSLKSYAKPYDSHPLNMLNKKSDATKEHIELEKGYIEEANSHLLELADFMASDEYAKNAPATPGLSQYKGGKEYYDYLKKYHLGYDIDTVELHELGVKMLAETKDKQKRIREKLGFDGSHEEFLQSLKGNERFYPSTPEKIGELMNGFKDKVLNAMPGFFNEIAKAKCSAKRLDKDLEKHVTFGYYVEASPVNNEGTYYYNGSGLDEKCQINISSLITHELIPGHHYQTSVASESKSLHPLFRPVFTTCYSEGWAEYVSKFMNDMGMFDDYDEYGRMEGEKFTATRIIVDTGLNELGWSLDKARKFMLDNTFATEDMANSETVRYCACIQAQCLPYRYGLEKMLEVKQNYKNITEDKFSDKDFHSLVLNVGNVPMNLLEKYIENAAKEKMS